MDIFTRVYTNTGIFCLHFLEEKYVLNLSKFNFEKLRNQSNMDCRRKKHNFVSTLNVEMDYVFSSTLTNENHSHFDVKISTLKKNNLSISPSLINIYSQLLVAVSLYYAITSLKICLIYRRVLGISYFIRWKYLILNQSKFKFRGIYTNSVTVLVYLIKRCI